MLARAAVAVLLLGGAAHAETWRLRAAIGNDAFTELIPPLDDQGFTNDLALAVARTGGDLSFGGAITHRIITARTGGLRWDQLDIVATAERTWPRGLAAGAWLGAGLGGNFGGRAIQNWWHDVSGTGQTLEQGLPPTYRGDRRAALLLGARETAAIGRRVQGYHVLAGQLALGETGVTRTEAAAGVRGIGRIGRTELGAHGELAVAYYRVGDPDLKLRGGYGEDWQLEWRLGAHVAWSRYRISYEYRANEGGSGEPIGALAFELRL